MTTTSTGNFFSSLWSFAKKIFSPNALKVEASVADALLPGFSPLINSAATAIIAAEGTATASGVQNGTGTQKMQIAVSLFQSTYNQWAAQNGLTQEPAAVQNTLQNVFNLLQGLNLVVGGTTSPSLPSTSPVPLTSTAAAVPAPSVSTQVSSGTLL